MSHYLLRILAWLATGFWAGVTIRTTLSTNADLSLLPLAFTALFGFIAVRIAREEDHDATTQDQ